LYFKAKTQLTIYHIQISELRKEKKKLERNIN